jgi:hypothetical protein
MIIADHTFQTTRECSLDQFFNWESETPIPGDIGLCTLSHEKAALYLLNLDPI